MQFSPDTRAALVIAHPGHELRVYGWLETARPRVFVLTDGSGRSGVSRLGSTAKVLSQAGAESGVIFGRLTDAEVYSRIFECDVGRFADLAAELAATFLDDGIEYVAGDASEGYNPAHDLCRLILNAAVGMIRRCTDRRILNFDFPLRGRPDKCHHSLLQQSIQIDLDDVGFERKLRVARNYPELVHEVEKTVSQNGVEAFRKECLRPVDASDETYLLEDPPFYEQYGEMQVAAGLYDRVLRYRQHMLPLAEALRSHVEQMEEL